MANKLFINLKFENAILVLKKEVGAFFKLSLNINQGILATVSLVCIIYTTEILL